jgi:hypothetical protein
MTDNLPPDPFPGGIPPLGFSELRNPFQELIDRAEREHAIMQFFGAIFGCMESEQVSLSRAIEICRDVWHFNRDCDPSVTPEMREISDELWTAAVLAANASFDKIQRLAALGR